jgi:hypothetical protein
VTSIIAVQPPQVSAWIDQQTRGHAAPTAKLRHGAGCHTYRRTDPARPIAAHQRFRNLAADDARRRLVKGSGWIDCSSPTRRKCRIFANGLCYDLTDLKDTDGFERHRHRISRHEPLPTLQRFRLAVPSSPARPRDTKISRSSLNQASERSEFTRSERWTTGSLPSGGSTARVADWFAAAVG